MKKRILSVVCICALLTGNAYAAPIDSVLQNSENGNIMVTGSFPAGCKYSVQVLKPGVTPEELANADDDTLSSLIQTLVNAKSEDGKYTVEIPMPEGTANGVYTVSVNSNVSEGVTRKTISWYSLAEITATYESIINANSANDIVGIINSEENCNKLGISYSMVNELDAGELADAADGIYDRLSEIESLDDLRDIYVEVVSPLAVASAGSNEAAIGYITDNAEKLGISDDEIYLRFTGLTDSVKLTTAERLRKSDISDADSLLEELEKAIFLSGIAEAGSVTDVHELIVENKSLFSSKIDKYFKATNTYSYDKKLVGKSYDNIDKFETALADAMKPSNSGSGSGGSSGGGGGSSYGGGTKDIITVPTQPVVEKKEAFDDISSVEWARVAIEALATEGIISGKGNNKFAPDDLVKREEFVKMLVGAFDVPVEGDEPFSDVSEDAWYYDYVRAAFNSGKVKGVSETEFGTGTNITRQDMAVLIYRFLSEKVELSQDGIVSFDDKIEISEYARNAVAVLREEGIISGVGENMFMPKDKCTRAQVAYIIYKALKYAGNI